MKVAPRSQLNKKSPIGLMRQRLSQHSKISKSPSLQKGNSVTNSVNKKATHEKNNL
jgi:hypothetical protein